MLFDGCKGTIGEGAEFNIKFRLIEKLNAISDVAFTITWKRSLEVAVAISRFLFLAVCDTILFALSSDWRITWAKNILLSMTDWQSRQDFNFVLFLLDFTSWQVIIYILPYCGESATAVLCFFHTLSSTLNVLLDIFLYIYTPGYRELPWQPYCHRLLWLYLLWYMGRENISGCGLYRKVRRDFQSENWNKTSIGMGLQPGGTLWLTVN